MGGQKKTSDAPSQNGGAANGGGKSSSSVENVDKIRDILFGNQMRDYERKFARLEERILNEVSRLREESAKRLNELEGYINKEIEALGGRVKSEQNDRSDGDKGLADELGKTAKLLDKKLAEMADRFDTGTREVRQQILEQSKTLSEEIGRKYDETRHSLERIAGELREEKLDRSTLSGLLTELALRLTDDTALLSGLEGESGDIE